MTPEQIRKWNLDLFNQVRAAGLPRLDPAENLVYVSTPYPLRCGLDVVGASPSLAACLIATNSDIELGCRILDSVLAYQDLAPDSPMYGNFFWFSHWRKVYDPNAVSFLIPHLGYLLKRQRDKLPPELIDRIDRALDISLLGLLAHRCQWSYTNIYLLNILCKLIIADELSSDRARKIAYFEWEEWYHHTNLYGNPEYNSPAYTAVQLRALIGMLSTNSDPSFLEEVKAILHWWFADLFLHYHPQTDFVTGAASRSGFEPCASGNYSSRLFVYQQLGITPKISGIWEAIVAECDYIVPERLRNLATNKKYPLTIEAYDRMGGIKRVSFMQGNFSVASQTGGKKGESEVPLILTYKSESERRSLFILPSPNCATFFSEQREDIILACLLWWKPSFVDKERYGKETLSGLRTGRPTNAVPPETSEIVVPFYLGDRAAVKEIVLSANEVWNFEEKKLSPETITVIDYGSVRVGLRFSEQLPKGISFLLEERKPEGEIVLAATLKAEELRSPFDAFAFLLVASEDAPSLYRQLRQATFKVRKSRGSLSARVLVDGRRISLKVPFETPAFLQTGQLRLGADEFPLGRKGIF